jgi:hypothetical protein
MADGGLFAEITVAYRADEQSAILSRFIAYAKERFDEGRNRRV